MRDHPKGRIAGWVLLALAGLALAVALSVAASNLSTQPIGLSGEQLRAGDRLAPAGVTRTTPKRHIRRRTDTTTAATGPAPTTSAQTGAGASGSGRETDDTGRNLGGDYEDD